MKRISKETVIFEMNRNQPPVAKVASKETVIFETLDCFSNTVKSEADTIKTIDFSKVNPATGPLFVEGAVSGDTLKVTIDKITITNTGVAMTAHGMGPLGEKITKEQTIIGQVHEDSIEFLGLTLPKRVMIGVIGTAPGKEGVNTGTPDTHGGNMDTILVREGATLYLPVEVDGALLSMGDMHGAMGDGEVGGSGLEVAGEIQVTVEVLKQCDLPLPFIETDELYVAIGSAPTLDEAATVAVDQMTQFVMKRTHMNLSEATILLSLAGDLKVSQAVNPNKTMRVELPKSVLKRP
ncbi:acetamidase/formamidase family protein [Allofustis seminis]|uniref:acetamidase/formamidase family protein n=1 Tax=Allofustis seminis TaxID=166939 RepID=UPI00036820DF|nr:acetamidase/formamidase family protein [Allofustis seminis]